MDTNNLNNLARSHKFIKRSSKIDAVKFINTLLYNGIDQEHTSLLDIKCDLEESFNCVVSREALHKRFTPEAVSFLKAILSKLLNKHLDFGNKSLQSGLFKRVCIKDSTKFRMPGLFFTDYPGYKVYHRDFSMMNIQYEYDILSGNWTYLELTKATRNDQLDSRETSGNIQSGDLCIRDLGYTTFNYLESIEDKKAFYLNRLPSIGVSILTPIGFEKINWEKLHKKMQKSGASEMELDVFIGNQKKIKARMVLFPVDKKVSEKRIRRASDYGDRKNGYQPSKEYRIKAQYSIFITNAPKEVLSIAQIQSTYRLRWQIEIIFKVWKSHLAIHKVKYIKKERLECQLLAKFIWIILNWKIFQVTNFVARKIHPKIACSVIKFYKRAIRFSSTLRSLAKVKNGIIRWLSKVILSLTESIIIEEKKHKISHPKILNELYILLS